MPKMQTSTLPSLLLLIFFFSFSRTFAVPTKKSYIVYLGPQSSDTSSRLFPIPFFQKTKEFQYNLLATLLGSKKVAEEAILYSYWRCFNGFAAILNDTEAANLARRAEVISVFENKGRKIHTTHSWNFLAVENEEGIPSDSIWKAANFGEDMIVANVDTGVWPESKSFSDEGYGPIPSKWRGSCPSDPAFHCNRKLLGGRFFYKGYEAGGGVLNATSLTLRDHSGHGTHTLSTAAGDFVSGANIFGHANGTAKGGAPKARVAAYKVCWPTMPSGECFDADILAAFDAAVNDGVDVISASIGGADLDFLNDPLAIAAFHAVRQGVLVVCSAGNAGPSPQTVSNVAPWEITVAASTTDRDFVSYVALGNNKRLKGTSLSSAAALPEQFYPLIESVNAKFSNVTHFDAHFCGEGTLDPNKVKGKILICLTGEVASIDKGYHAAGAGAVGMIVLNDVGNRDDLIPELHFLPASDITYSDAKLVYQYIDSTRTPVAQIMNVRTDVGLKSAPVMASFSSRGPNPIEKSILKPDITAPGVNILAAYPTKTSLTTSLYDQRRSLFQVLSGTSMACPHISGIAALLKSIHPEWSPAAIKSAIMTTAKTKDNNLQPILDSTNLRATPFAYGAGHVSPNDAMDPGLVYDATVDDYLNFFCAQGYNASEIRRIYEKPFTCSKSFKLTDLNYPSISIPNLNESAPVKVNRRVKNVGSPGKYVARVEVPLGVTVSVEPSTLQFSSVGEEKAFKVLLQNTGQVKREGYVFGKLIWSDGKHFVGSPIAMNLRQ